MAAKLLHSLADDNPDLQKQLGCMTGIFQLFDRQNALTGRRLSHRRLPPGDSHGSSERQSFNVYQRPSAAEINFNKSSNANHRISTESSRTSFSSSCSSVSSLDGYRAAQPESSSYDRIIFPETPSRDAVLTQPTTYPHLGRQSLDPRDVVKDSMYHEAKPKDSAKKFQHSKSTNGNGTNGKQSASADMRELRVLAELQEASWHSNDKASHSFSKDAPRFSYDGRDTIKSNLKLKELPRLSLDGREKSLWDFNSDANAQQSLRSQRRLPSVVAKLMGLEALPSASNSQSGVVKSFHAENDVKTPILIPKSPKSSLKEPISPRWKNPDLIMKPISRLPIEPAPWKQAEEIRASWRPVKVSARSSNLFPTVYSEIEKRLKDIEFNQSGKDLRALKQILEAMQARKEEQGSNQNNTEPSCISPGRKLRISSQRYKHDAHVSVHDSPIVIMKPSRFVEKSGLPSSSVIPTDGLNLLHRTPSNGHIDNRNRLPNTRTAKDQSPRISHLDSVVNSNDKKANVRNTSTQPSTRPQQSPKASATSSVKSSLSVSPRLQQKKLELERKSRPPTPPSDSSHSTKPRRQSNRMSSESSSPGGKNRPKSHKMPQNDDQLSQISNESRTSSHQGEDPPQQSDSNVEQSLEFNDGQIPSMRTGNHLDSVSMQKKPSSRLEQDGTLEDAALDTVEHPSPVSVLDMSVCRDILSPTGDGSVHSVLSNSRKKLQNIDNLVKKLRRLNSTHDEASNDYIASLCENTNPDHRYITEILLASGILLRDLEASMSTFQLHPTSHAINPELFLVLEQTKARTLQSKEDYSIGKVKSLKQTNLERFHRKLIFDAVNEVIVKKLQGHKLVKTSLNAQKLLKEVCLEIERLQAKKSERCPEEEEDDLKGILWDDVMSGCEKWTDFNGEISGVVLDIERSIFKDLVDEIVMGGAAKKPVKRRQLYAT